MACGLGLDAEDCAADHWSRPLKGRREPSGQWRADCPVDGCRTGRRGLEYDAPGKHVRWKSFCGEHDKDAVRPFLVALIGPCMPSGGSQRLPIRHDELTDLALADLPPMTRQLRMLQLAGMGTQEALDKLRVRRENRSRVIAGKTGGASKRMQNRRS
jgi:hypothetical protein